MEKENIKDAVNVLISNRKYSQVVPEQLENNKPQQNLSKVVNVQLPALGENLNSDPSANTLLFKPGLSNAQIEQTAIPGDLQIIPQVANIINSALKKIGYTGQGLLTKQQEDQVSQIISVDLQNFLSAHSAIISNLAVK